MKILFLAFIFMFVSCNLLQRPGSVSVTVNVTSIDSIPENQFVYLAGNTDQLGNWMPDAYRLEREDSTTWTGIVQAEAGQLLELKVTRGSWQNEAVDSMGVEYPNQQFVITNDTSIIIRVHHWRDLDSEHPVLSLQRMRNKGGQIEIFENWRFKKGDNPEWAETDYDDSEWDLANSRSFMENAEQLSWSGIAWFRMHFTVDSSLCNKSVAMQYFQSGASQIYLNGNLIYSMGNVATEGHEIINAFDQNPKVLTFSSSDHQVIAIRYADHDPSQFFPRGFFIRFSELNNAIDDSNARTRRFSILQSIFTVLPLTLALIHLLLFLYFRKSPENIFYALFMLSFAVLSYSNFQITFTSSINQIRINQIMTFGSINLAGVFGLLTSYWHCYAKIPKYFYFFPLVSIGFMIYLLYASDSSFNTYFIGYLVLMGLEFIRIMIISFIRNPKKDWPIVVGFIALAISIFYQILLDSNVLQPIGNFDIVYVYGVLIMGIAMSVNLARDFAKTNIELIQRDKIAQEQVIERRLLEADNLRKTLELEDARKLQLSMLPSEIPKPDHLDIAVYMKTATEVGGDYYDFLYNDQELTIAIGDATGHGTKAGIMVALIKNLFNTMGNTFFIPDFFTHCTKMIRKMSLGMLYMSMSLIRIKGNIVYFSAAGMPPVIMYRHHENKVEELVVKGLPLGGSLTAQYEQKRTEFKPGDTMLLMTDGFAERFNAEKESLDYDRILQRFEQIGSELPEMIIGKLVKLGEEWAGGTPQNDDITFVIVKHKQSGQ